MLRRHLLQPTRYAFVFVLAVPLIFSSFTVNGFFAASHAREQRALRSLRTIVARSDAPSDAQLQSIVSRFPDTRAAALAQLLRGAQKYANDDFAGAADILRERVIQHRTIVGDHALFMLANSLVKLNRLGKAEERFEQITREHPASVYVRDARLQASALAAKRGDLRRAASYLAPLAEQKDTGALLQVAQLYQRSNDPKRAIEIYEELVFDLPPSREAIDAERQLEAAGVLVKGSTQTPFPRLRKRAQALYRAEAYGDVVQLYDDFLKAYPETAKDEALILHYGTSLYQMRSLRQATRVLKALEPKSQQLLAEKLYYLAETYRRGGREAAFISISQQLVKQFPHSSWTAETLHSRARHFLRQGRRDLAVGPHKQLVKLHPQSPYAPEASYRLGMEAYFNRRYDEASQHLLDHVTDYVNSDYYGPTLYWAARAEERRRHPPRALAIFQRVLERYRSTIYGQMAQVRIQRLLAKHRGLQPPQLDSDSPLGRALANVKRAQPPQSRLNDVAKNHLEKARQLRIVRLDELAAKDLRAALKQDSNSPTVSFELARIYRDQGDRLAAITIMRRAHPEYTLYQGGEVSGEEDRLLFPLSHWDIIQREAQRHGLDPYFVAGLIRQESGFKENARSRAGARGLMQLIPSTGRLVARRSGIRRPSIRQLYEPELNIQLGTSYLAGLVEQFKKIEVAAAGYNAGPLRPARWLREHPNLEMDEWIERIPFRETRRYVKAVMRNAAHYRRIYGQQEQANLWR